MTMRNRRGFLIRIVQGFGITGLGFLTYPFIRALIPTFGGDLSLDVSIDDLNPGQTKVIHWLGRNIIVHRRSQSAIQSLQDSDIDLKDPNSKASIQPNFAENNYRSQRPELFVTFNNCTHLGCEVNQTQNKYVCPCHQSDYDSAGRVVNGAAAPTNLEIPYYEYISGNAIRLSESIKEGTT